MGCNPLNQTTYILRAHPPSTEWRLELTNQNQPTNQKKPMPGASHTKLDTWKVRAHRNLTNFILPWNTSQFHCTFNLVEDRFSLGSDILPYLWHHLLSSCWETSVNTTKEPPTVSAQRPVVSIGPQKNSTYWGGVKPQLPEIEKCHFIGFIIPFEQKWNWKKNGHPSTRFC